MRNTLSIFFSQGFYDCSIYNLLCIPIQYHLHRSQTNIFIAPNLIMSSNQSFALINGLKPRIKKSRMQVKLIHSWRQTPPYADETLELVLADQTVSSAETVFLYALYTALPILKF